MTVEVDTVRVRGPIRDSRAMLAMRWQSVVGEAGRPEDAPILEGGVYEGRDVLPCGARISVDMRNDGIPEAAVEFSAPKVATGSNVFALPHRDLFDVIDQVVNEAGRLVDWSDPVEALRVGRVDVDRDFTDVEHAGPLLGGLSRLRVARNPQTRFFPDGERGNAGTLTRGNPVSWTATLYDKAAEAAHRARHAGPADQLAAKREAREAQGRLRYEARFRGRLLRPSGIGTVADLCTGDGERVLLGMRREYFDRVGYGMAVTGLTRASELVMSHDEIRVNTRLAVLGWLLLESQGVAPEMHRNRSAGWRKRCREIGVTADDLLAVAATDVRLDFDAGRMVAA